MISYSEQNPVPSFLKEAEENSPYKNYIPKDFKSNCLFIKFILIILLSKCKPLARFLKSKNIINFPKYGKIRRFLIRYIYPYCEDRLLLSFYFKYIDPQ